MCIRNASGGGGVLHGGIDMTVFCAVSQKIMFFSQKIAFYMLILSDKSLFLLDYSRI